jgi:hypothetical protein
MSEPFCRRQPVPSRGHLIDKESIFLSGRWIVITSQPQPRTGSRFTFPCSERAVDVVEAADAALDAKVLGVVLAQLLGCKLLQAIGILRLKRNTEGI